MSDTLNGSREVRNVEQEAAARSAEQDVRELDLTRRLQDLDRQFRGAEEAEAAQAERADALVTI